METGKEGELEEALAAKGKADVDMEKWSGGRDISAAELAAKDAKPEKRRSSWFGGGGGGGGGGSSWASKVRSAGEKRISRRGARTLRHTPF